MVHSFLNGSIFLILRANNLQIALIYTMYVCMHVCVKCDGFLASVLSEIPQYLGLFSGRKKKTKQDMNLSMFYFSSCSSAK